MSKHRPRLVGEWWKKRRGKKKSPEGKKKRHWMGKKKNKDKVTFILAKPYLGRRNPEEQTMRKTFQKVRGAIKESLRRGRT